MCKTRANPLINTIHRVIHRNALALSPKTNVCPSIIPELFSHFALKSTQKTTIRPHLGRNGRINCLIYLLELVLVDNDASVWVNLSETVFLVLPW